MRLLAKCIGILAVCIGIVGVFSPASLIAAGYHSLNPVALYVIAAVRIGVGVVLIGAASGSRMPKTLRVLGAIIVLAGIATALAGIERPRMVLDWLAGEGAPLARFLLCIPIAIGGLILYAVCGRRQTA